MLELILRRTLFDIVLEEVRNINILLTVVAGGDISALSRQVLVIEVFLLKPRIRYSTILTTELLLSHLLPLLNLAQFFVNVALHRH